MKPVLIDKEAIVQKAHPCGIINTQTNAFEIVSAVRLLDIQYAPVVKIEGLQDGQRLIDVSTLLDQLRQDREASQHPLASILLSFMEQYIAAQPVVCAVIDDKLERYGHWIYEPYGKCSECGKPAIAGYDSDYCPHCGAKMKRREANEK